MDELEQGQQKLRNDVNKMQGRLTKIFELLQERDVGGTSSGAGQKQQATRCNSLGLFLMPVQSFGRNSQEMMVPPAVCPYNHPQATLPTPFPSYQCTATTPNTSYPLPYRSMMSHHPPCPIHSQHIFQAPNMPYAVKPSQMTPPHPYNPTTPYSIPYCPPLPTPYHAYNPTTQRSAPYCLPLPAPYHPNNPTTPYFPPHPTPPRAMFTTSPRPNQSPIHVPNSNPNQQKRGKKQVQPDPIPMSYTELLPHLIRGSLVVPHPLPPVEPPYPRGYDPNAKCDYHAGAPGHSTENCRALKRKVQELIKAKWLSFEGNDPNPVIKNGSPADGVVARELNDGC